nr:MAG TPA: hypothetical protein [Bacteriophage sp.]
MVQAERILFRQPQRGRAAYRRGALRRARTACGRPQYRGGHSRPLRRELSRMYPPPRQIPRRARKK